MSRTYRRKEGKGRFDFFSKAFVCSDLEHIDGGSWEFVPLPADSKEYRVRSAMYHSDATTTRFKEPGPGWFRNLFCERSQRREAKLELHKFMLNPEHEVLLMAKNHLPYWT